MTDGYPVELSYTAGFYPETAPAWLAFAGAASGGLTGGDGAGRAASPARVLELGFGQGFGLALLAAANPDTVFEGCDYNPAHVAHAQGWAEAAALANLKVSAASFGDMAAAAGDADVDVIIAHGVMSWIPQEARDAVVEIVRSRLRAGGRLHLSYNCSPGAAPDAPLRDLFQAVAARTPGPPQVQVKAALALIRSLRDGGASYLVHNPVAAAHVAAMLDADPVYLAHEYLGADWRIFTVAEMAARLAPAGVNYLCSAWPVDNIAGCAVPAALQPLVDAAEDPIWRETLRDLAANRAFRRDIYRRPGDADLDDGDDAGGRTNLADWRFILTVPRPDLSLAFSGPLGGLGGHPQIYLPLADAMAAQPAGGAALSALVPFRGRPKLLAEALSFLVQSGQVAPIPPGRANDPAPAARFNREVVARARDGVFYGTLASSVTGSGVPVSELDLLAMSAIEAGCGADADLATDHVLGLLAALDRATLDGAPVAPGKDGRGVLRPAVQEILEHRAPLWSRLGIPPVQAPG